MNYLYSIGVFLLGVVILLSEIPLRKGSFYYDYTQIKWIVAPLLITWALVMFVRTLKAPSQNRIFYKCLNCGKVIKLKYSSSNICPKCNSKVEELEGFFERN